MGVHNVVKLVKKGDTYKPAKLAASVRGAGASPAVAKKIVASVKVWDGMATLELRKQVTELLEKLDPKAAKVYKKSRKK